MLLNLSPLGVGCTTAALGRGTQQQRQGLTTVVQLVAVVGHGQAVDDLRSLWKGVQYSMCMGRRSMGAWL